MIPKTMKSVINHLEDILHVNTILTPEMIEKINKSSIVDAVKIDKLSKSAQFIESKKETLDGLHANISIMDDLVGMKEEISTASSMKDDVKRLLENKNDIAKLISMKKDISAIVEMKQLLSDIKDMKDDISYVSDMKDDIELAANISEKIRDDILRLEVIRDNVSDAEERISKKLSDAEEINTRTISLLKNIENKILTLKNISVSSCQINSDEEFRSEYDSKTNTIKLYVPKAKDGKRGEKGDRGDRGDRGIPGIATNQGKQGEPGINGRNGENFKVDIYGMKKEMSMYGNRAVGTSFVSLDESPSMIYFRKSNSLDDWTDGQPFGISHGDFSVEEIASLVVELLKNKGA